MPCYLLVIVIVVDVVAIPSSRLSRDILSVNRVIPAWLLSDCWLFSIYLLDQQAGLRIPTGILTGALVSDTATGGNILKINFLIYRKVPT